MPPFRHGFRVPREALLSECPDAKAATVTTDENNASGGIRSPQFLLGLGFKTVNVAQRDASRRPRPSHDDVRIRDEHTCAKATHSDSQHRERGHDHDRRSNDSIRG